jgi:hypothetical protein
MNAVQLDQQQTDTMNRAHIHYLKFCDVKLQDPIAARSPEYSEEWFGERTRIRQIIMMINIK